MQQLKAVQRGIKENKLREKEAESLALLSQRQHYEEQLLQMNLKLEAQQAKVKEVTDRSTKVRTHHERIERRRAYWQIWSVWARSWPA